MSLASPGEPIREKPATWPVARAWLYGWVRTDVPGHRELQIGGSVPVITSASYRFDQLITQIGSDLSGLGWTASIANTGRVTLSGTSAIVAYPDRLGWLLGLAPDAFVAEAATSASIAARWVSPTAIPLLAAQWERVDTEREVESILDRAGRRSGFAFGGSRLWRWRVRMTRWGYQALQTGWCLRGKVTISPHASTVTAASSSQSGGGVTGYVIAVDSVSWTGPTEELVDLEIVIAGVDG